MAEKGVGRKKLAKSMILEGRVKLNGEVLTKVRKNVHDNDILVIDDKEFHVNVEEFDRLKWPEDDDSN